MILKMLLEMKIQRYETEKFKLKLDTQNYF